MNKAQIHMAAMSIAIRKLMAGHPLAKPDTLAIAAAEEVTTAIISRMLSVARMGGTTFLALFRVEDDEALLERIMICDGTTSKNVIQVGCGNFIAQADGTYAIASFNMEDGYQYTISRNGRRLRRRPTRHAADRALVEVRGIQALMTEAASADCQAEAVSAIAFDT